MSIDLTVKEKMSKTVQVVQDQDENKSALSLGNNAVQIKGKDICGTSLPLMMEQDTTGLIYSPEVDGEKNTLGRFLRFAHKPDNQVDPFIIDFGIDKKGTLTISGNNSWRGKDFVPILKITQNGDVTITGNLTVEKSIIYQGCGGAGEPDKGMVMNTTTKVIGWESN